MKVRIVREFAAVGLAFVMLTGCGSQPADTYPAALIKDAPNEENAKIFIDYIISLDMEKELIEKGFFDLSIRPDADVEGISVKGMSVNLVDVYDMLETSSNDMQELFATN